jgi:hypothetical protein
MVLIQNFCKANPWIIAVVIFNFYILLSLLDELKEDNRAIREERALVIDAVKQFPRDYVVA